VIKGEADLIENTRYHEQDSRLSFLYKEQ